MALTPEDVVNKRFQPTKFREGYDQDEVDDFLDEVVVELRRLNQENEELRQRLIASDSRISELSRSGGQTSHAQDNADSAVVPAPVAAAPAVVEPEPTPEPVAAAVVPAPAPAVEEEDEATSTTNLLQLARRLHEEHVREGVEKRDSLIAEGHATASRIVAEAEAEQRTTMALLEKDRAVLEGRIEELQVFEREYRSKLKAYIQGQLEELEAPTGSGKSLDAVSSPPANFSGFAGN
ncbi:DivIVA domain-containing protein [Glaciihabitans sp. dw_435]|uniref:DivIVA domain-containing protein n=1 Tax=Glaciihabitans sp. dw_435 TaxID=2720081 RepID=UPI0021042749|nr:DivIVA domain-containing protein [Glaciihabitans sp. dw_435]